MRYYLAGPVDYAKQDWRTHIVRLCKEEEATKSALLFNPDAAYHFERITNDGAKFIHDVNMFALDEADVLVCRLMEEDKSVGTPIELYWWVKETSKPVLLITDMDKSVYIQYMASHRSTVIRCFDLAAAHNEIIRLEFKLLKKDDDNEDDF